ncbi:unnamed protein product [Blepharisma stoltei]|uniref:Uncharacterized protein n=1 Tax=Blepharisma stoltei TaxID=1481888 RepID=A0AAU9IN03_9CILI|nr:unnamed protein product [Blepharisma stoltei]
MLQPKSRGPKATSLTPTKKKSLQKKPWDDRFWLGSLPLNDSSLDTSSFISGDEGKSSKEIKSRKLIRLPQLSSRPTSSRARSVERTPQNKSINHLIVTEEMLNEIKENIECEWITWAIPEPQREAFRNSVFNLPRNKAYAIINREIDDLQKSRSLVQLVLRAITAREESLKSIQEMNEYLSKAPDWDKLKEVQLECAELLHAHRILTLNVVESIVKWREQLVYAMLLNQTDSSKKTLIPFIWEGINYIEKMRHDLDFLYSSDFSKVFLFSEKPDPLLKTPSRIQGGSRHKSRIKDGYFMDDGKVVIPLPSALMKRVSIAEMVILENTSSEWETIQIDSTPTSKSSRELSTTSNNRLKQRKPNEEARMAQNMLDCIIEEEVEIDVQEIVVKVRKEEQQRVNNDATAKYVMDEILKKEILETIREIAVSTYSPQFNANMEKYVENMANKMIESEVLRTIDTIAKDELRNAKEQLKKAKEDDKRKKGEDINLNKYFFEVILAEVVKSMTEFEVENISKEIKDRAAKKKMEIEKKKIEEENTTFSRQIFMNFLYEIVGEIAKEMYEIKENEEREKKEIAKKNNENLELAKLIYESLFEIAIKIRLEEFSKVSINEVKTELENAEKRKAVESEKKKKMEEICQLTNIFIKDLTCEAISIMIQTELKSCENERLAELIFEDFITLSVKTLKESQANESLIEEKTLQASENDTKLQNSIIADQIYEEMYRDIESDILPLIKKEIDDMTQRKLQEEEKLQSTKARQLLQSQIEEMIQRNLIETVIDELKVNIFAENIINEEIEAKKLSTQNETERKKIEEKEKALENEKICSILYDEIVNEFLKEAWVGQLSENMIENANMLERRRTTVVPQLIFSDSIAVEVKEAEDYAIENFTPGMHSPNIYSIRDNDIPEEEKSISSVRSGIFEDLGLDFATIDSFRDLGSLEFKPLNIQEHLIGHVLNEYFRFIPSLIKAAFPNIEQLKQEVMNGIDACWYWALKNEKILGLLIYSLDPSYKTGRNLIIHHISCLHEKSYPQIIDLATTFLWNIDTCDEIRVNLFSGMGNDIPSQIKKIFTNLKFKWKTHSSIVKYNADLTVMGKMRTNIKPNADARSQNSDPFVLKSFCIVEPSNEEAKSHDITCPEMIQVGNRQCLVSAILNLFGQLAKSGINLTMEPKTRLQRDISDVLEIINSTDSYTFPFIKSSFFSSQPSAQSFLQENKISPSLISSSKSSISILELNFNWISCTNLITSLKSQNYKFIRFKSSEIKHCKNADNCELFWVPTGQAGISAFFIDFEGIKDELSADLRRNKTDLFYKLEDLFQSMNLAKEGVIELWVPAFKKKVSWVIPWIQGYEIPEQHGENESQYVKKCIEDVNIEINVPPPAPGILEVGKIRGKFFKNDFIFGLVNRNGDKILDLPLITCLVEQNDWTLA